MKSFFNLITFWIGWPFRLLGVSVRVSQWIGYAVLILAVLIVFGLVYTRCFKSTPKLNEAEIQKGEQAVKDRNDKELKEILAAADARETQIDANVANAEAQTEKVKEDAKKKYDGMTVDELAAELEKRK